MARRTATVTSLYGDLAQPNLAVDGAITWANLMGQADLAASLRRDLAGGPTSVMRSPATYQAKVTAMWTAYHTDPLFKQLVDRTCNFVANGSHWEVTDPTSSPDQKWPDRILRWFSAKENAVEYQAEVWNAWANQINIPAPNTTQGLNQIVHWATRHFLLSGMWVPHWQWGAFKYGRKVYLMPTQLTCYPTSQVTLLRPQQQFMTEQIFVMLTGIGQPMTGMTVEAPQVVLPGGGISPNVIPLELIGARPELRAGLTEAMAVKYNWSPGDLSTTRIGPILQTGWGQYPSPPFVSLLPQFAVRQKLFAADLALADAVATYQKVFKVGDKDNPLKAQIKDKSGRILQKGTLAEISEVIQAGLANPAFALYLPYWVDYELKLPSMNSLLNDDKYISSHTEILNAFGLLSARSLAGRNEKYQELNTAGFEEMLEGLRRVVGAFLMRLAMRIMDVNPVFTAPPIWQPNPVNTKSKEFKANLIRLAEFGRISTKTLMQHLGINDDVEQRRIAEDLARQADDLYDDNVPISFAQTSTSKGVTPDMPGDEDQSKILSPTDQATPDGGTSSQPAKPAKRRYRKRTTITSPPPDGGDQQR